MKTEKKKIVILFLLTVVVYSVIVSLFSSTVHIDADEELYVSLAKSFHYDGKFEYGNQLLDYSCVLYSMLISLTYYFYSPSNILLFMRIIGVIAICSSVFPIFLLAKAFLKDGRKSLMFSAFLMIMPYMFDSAYMMQEVLSYPLFLWTVYFLLQAFENRDRKKFWVLGAVFSILCVFTKTYMFFIPISLNLCLLYFVIMGRNKKEYIVKMVIYDVVYLFLFAGMHFMIFAINGFEKGSNHYSNQFLSLFPISANTLIFGVLGCVIYAALIVINTGIFPISAILYEWRTEKERTSFINFVLISIFFLILEIVFMIVLTEQGIGTPPYKFLFRCFQIFVPLMLILFVKYINDNLFWNSFEIRSIADASKMIEEKKNQRVGFLAKKNLLSDVQDLNILEMNNEKIDIYILKDDGNR